MIGLDDISGVPSFSDQDMSSSGGGSFTNSGAWTITKAVNDDPNSVILVALLAVSLGLGVMSWLAFKK